jgi:hypothetical protein
VATNSTSDCVEDCSGVISGPALVDNCGVCDANPNNDCVQDCAGVFGGPALVDNCGTCDANPANDCPQDCNGVPGGPATRDNCNVCDENPDNDCTPDCNGVFGGPALLDNCGVCDSNPNNDCTPDCAGVFGGASRRDPCGICDTNPNNDCTADCAGVFGGASRRDACGTCDANPGNDCFDGTSGTLVTPQDVRFDIGTGGIFWTISAQQLGFIYSNGAPDITYAQVLSTSACGDVGDNSGYTGIASLAGLTNAAALSFSPAEPPIRFGTQQSTCYAGLLVFQQSGRYGVIEFVRTADGGQTGVLDDLLTLNYWVGSPGVTDFSRAR